MKNEEGEEEFVSGAETDDVVGGRLLVGIEVEVELEAKGVISPTMLVLVEEMEILGEVVTSEIELVIGADAAVIVGEIVAVEEVLETTEEVFSLVEEEEVTDVIGEEVAAGSVDMGEVAVGIEVEETEAILTVVGAEETGETVFCD